jgi:hypothetical protein
MDAPFSTGRMAEESMSAGDRLGEREHEPTDRGVLGEEWTKHGGFGRCWWFGVVDSIDEGRDAENVREEDEFWGRQGEVST